MNEEIESNSSEDTNQIQYSAFVTHETPHCLWDLDLKESNGAFLDGIDPLYFKHIADVHGPLLEGKNKQHAAMALRAAYAQGLETLFALIGSVIQAPECPIGWMIRYQNKDLDELIKKVHNHEPVLSRFNVEFFTWDSLSEIIHCFGDNLEENLRVRALFARFWQSFASDFLDEKLQMEYKSIRHGLRAKMEGSQISLNLPALDGMDSPGMIINLPESEFGSRLFRQVKLSDARNFRVTSQLLNWNPGKCTKSLAIISYSILNLVAYLKYINGESVENINVYFPNFDKNEEKSDKTWSERSFTSALVYSKSSR